MCETCGCGNSNGFTIHDPGHKHDHNHDHDHEHDHNHSHSHRKVVDLNLDILTANNIAAGMNRRFFEGRKVLCLNMVSSPGSGKTTILEKSISTLMSSRKLFVIEGDQQTQLDSERIEKAGAPAIQINTGSGCHLDAHMIETALGKMNPEMNSILFIENVGNLVCPAMFDLGELKRVIVISVTEGEDKPLKYPFMFESSQLCLINKTDLLPYVDFNIDKFMNNARLINQTIEFIPLSAKTGDGINLWIEWILEQG